MWVQGAVCRLLAQKMGSLGAIVSLTLRLLAPNVSRKRPLFASPSLTVCGPLHLMFSRAYRYRQLMAKGKHANQVVVAMARELAGCMGAMAQQVPVTASSQDA
jgi:hypothetical protein